MYVIVYFLQCKAGNHPSCFRNNIVITSDSFAYPNISAGQTGTSLSLAKHSIKLPCPPKVVVVHYHKNINVLAFQACINVTIIIFGETLNSIEHLINLNSTQDFCRGRRTSDVLIPRVGSGRSGNRPSGRVLPCNAYQGQAMFLAKFQVTELVRKIVIVGVLGHTESKSGLQFVLHATIQQFRTGFLPKFYSIL